MWMELFLLYYMKWALEYLLDMCGTMSRSWWLINQEMRYIEYYGLLHLRIEIWKPNRGKGYHKIPNARLEILWGPERLGRRYH